MKEKKICQYPHIQMRVSTGQKFKNDEAFQLKHLEIEFKEFLKLTGGQSIDNVQRIDDQNIQLFVKLCFY